MDRETRSKETPRDGGQPDISGWPGPLRRFADRLDEVRSAEIFDMDQVGGFWWSWLPMKSFSIR